MKRINILGAAFIVLGLGLGGCGRRWESNAVALEAADGAPVRIVNARMRHSVSVAVGSQGVSISSSTPANAIGLAFDVELTDAAPEHGGVSGRLVCRVGEHAITTKRAHDASGRLHKAEVGATLEEYVGEPPSAFHEGIPSTCEAELFYEIAPPIGSPAEPDAMEVSLGRLCLADGVLRVGTCTDDELPRIAPEGKVGIGAVKGRIGKLAGSAQWGVELSALFTAGVDAPEHWQASAKVHCSGADGDHDVSMPMLILGRSLRPGESVAGTSSTSPRSGLDTEPKQCTVTFRVGVGDGVEDLAQYCVHGETIDAGACPA